MTDGGADAGGSFDAATSTPEVPSIEVIVTPDIPATEAAPLSPEPPISPPPQPTATPANPITSFLSAALEKIQFRRRAKLDKILQLAAKKHSIKNDDVEKLLRVSDATASRYLLQLVKEGRLKRVGAQKQPTYQPV